MSVSSGPQFTKDAHEVGFLKLRTRAIASRITFSQRDVMPHKFIHVCEIFVFGWLLTSIGAVPVFKEEDHIYTRGVDYCVEHGVKLKRFPTKETPELFANFSKSILAQFWCPSCHHQLSWNTFFANATVEVSNRGLKRILKRTMGENRASWSDKLDDARGLRTEYKTPIGCTPYKLVYGKACHLPIELEHKAYWALQHANFDLKTAEDQA
ncbi:reverse transcriptase domain-containing protein [Tanacetum coccineum]